MTTTTSIPKHNYKAVRNPDGTFNIPTPEGDFGNVPYIGEYRDYREMDAVANFDRKIYAETGYVCRVEHNEENEFVFFYPMGVGQNYEYIII